MPMVIRHLIDIDDARKIQTPYQHPFVIRLPCSYSGEQITDY